MGYAMSSAKLLGAINYEIFTLDDINYHDSFPTDTISGGTGTEYLFVWKMDMTDIDAFRYQIEGKKLADASTDNYLRVRSIEDSYNDVNIGPFPDTNTLEIAGWDNCNTTGIKTMAIFVDGGNDYQKIKHFKLWLIRNR